MTLLQEKQEKIVTEMHVYHAVVALVADPKSHESFYLIKITKEEKGKTEDMEYGLVFLSLIFVFFLSCQFIPATTISAPYFITWLL